MDKFIKTNDIQLHYIEHEGQEPAIILMHGLTANAHSFDGYLNAGFKHRILAVDLRGRGQSDKPAHGYTMDDHAKDIIGILDELNIEKAVVGGHSFGALLSIFLAYHYPERIEKIIMIDAAARLHPNTREMVGPAMARLGQKWDSFDDYIEKIKAAPYIKEHWLPEMESYFRADVKDLDDGSITTLSSLENITEAVNGALGPGEKWLEYISRVEQPAILINATEEYVDGNPILPKELALETVSMMKNCSYLNVSGNHLTMMFGEGAKEAVVAIEEFLNNKTS